MKDLSRNYADPTLSAKQRAVANPQVERLHNGNPFIYFQVVGEAANRIGLELDSVTLLDVGCGTAYYSEVLDILKPRWATYEGIDYNKGMLELATALYPELTFHHGNICDLPFGDLSFDVVLSGACIMHVRDWKRAVGELARVARRFLLLHRNPIRTKPRLETLQAYGSEFFHWYFNQRELINQATGFELIETYELGGLVKSFLLRRKTS